MIVYGDQRETIHTGSFLNELTRRRDHLRGTPPGIARHAELVGLHIEAGRLAQGVADAAFDPQRGDAPSIDDERLMMWLVASAGCLVRSWMGGFEFEAPPPLPTLDAVPEQLTLSVPEGYAFHALHPESYIDAARLLRDRGPGVRVIGVRSIGTSLAPLVAAVLGTPPPITVRPTGHPFSRELRLCAPAQMKLLDGAEHFVVVDEGPGLSGSSFAAVARLLWKSGVGLDRITFMPSHSNGPGSETSEETKKIWAGVAVRPALQMPDSRIAGWVADLVGEDLVGAEDLSGGRWRAKLFDKPSQWPPIDPRTDRRKLLVRTTAGAYFARFIGLGSSAERKHDRARRLAQDGFVPPVLGAVNGFLVQPWIEPASPCRPDPAEIGRYLHARLGLPPPVTAGSDVDALREMALANTAESLGPRAADRLSRKLAGYGNLKQEIEAVAIDGACQPWKWFRSERGQIFKADALDHDADHDIIGAQPIGWDVVGAAIELGYDRRSVEDLNAMVFRGRKPPRREGFLFLASCYLAFRVGAARMAARALRNDPDDRRRAERAEGAYRKQLEQLCFSDW